MFPHPARQRQILSRVFVTLLQCVGCPGKFEFLSFLLRLRSVDGGKMVTSDGNKDPKD